jgi:hypothetical protein
MGKSGELHLSNSCFLVQCQSDIKGPKIEPWCAPNLMTFFQDFQDKKG